MNARVFAVALLCAASVAPAAHAIPIDIPSTRTPLSASPPLAGSGQLERVFPGHIASATRVLVALDARGGVTRVRASNRVVIQAQGDYSFAVAAPVVDVAAGAGSASVPGLRSGAILWQGFSPGKRILVAAALLRTKDVRPFLPVRIAVSRRGGVVVVVITNATAMRVPTPVGAVEPRAAAVVLDRLRAAVAADRATGVMQLDTRNPVRRQIVAVAPLRIRGRLSVARAERRFAARLGRRLTIRLRAGSGTPHLALTVDPVPPLRELGPPGARTWKRAVARGTVRNGRLLLERALAGTLAAARTHQYEAFLQNPDPAGPTATTYVFRTSNVAAAATPPPADGGSGGSFPLVISLVLAASAAAAGVVLWAHS